MSISSSGTGAGTGAGTRACDGDGGAEAREELAEHGGRREEVGVVIEKPAQPGCAVLSHGPRVGIYAKALPLFLPRRPQSPLLLR